MHLILMNALALWLNDSVTYGHDPPDRPEMKAKVCPPATDMDPRHVGWPCMGQHHPGKERANKFAAWQACSRCGLRLRYITKGTGHGETRAIGPTPEMVNEAQQELREQFTAMEMNEKIFNGKLMELRGRTLVESGGYGRTTVQVRADEKLGEALMSSSACGTTRTPKKSPKRTTSPAPRSPSPIRPTSKGQASLDKTEAKTETGTRSSGMMPKVLDLEETVSVATEESVEVLDTAKPEIKEEKVQAE